MRFYLGTPEPTWLGRATVPLFVSAVRMRRRETRSRPKVRWALDSGGFSELSLRGRWTIDAPSYAAEVVRWSAVVGAPDWAAIQDWMCEPFILEKTGKTVIEHQQLTIASLRELRGLAPAVHWIPVVQGWTVDDYVRRREVLTAPALAYPKHDGWIARAA